MLYLTLHTVIILTSTIAFDPDLTCLPIDYQLSVFNGGSHGRSQDGSVASSAEEEDLQDPEYRNDLREGGGEGDFLKDLVELSGKAPPHPRSAPRPAQAQPLPFRLADWGKGESEPL